MGREATDANKFGPGVVLVNDEWLTQEVISAVAVGAAHAVMNAGTSGDAVIETTLLASQPMFLHHGRSHFDESWNGIPVTNVPVGRHTIELDDVTASIGGLLSASRLVLNDLVQAFGVPDSPHLPGDGGIDIRYFSRDNQQRATQEAKRLGFPVADS